METIISSASAFFFSQSIQEQNALFGGALVFIGYIIYWFATIFGKTRPNRVTWAVLTLVGFSIAVSYWDATDASPNARGIALAHSLGAFITFLTSIWYGQTYTAGDRTQKQTDALCFLLGIASIATWQAHVWGLFAFEDIVGIQMVSVALIMGILADFFGLLPTIRKSWRYPQSESLIAWGVTVLGEVIALYGIVNWNSYEEILYPLYLVVANGLVLLFLCRGVFKRTTGQTEA